MSSQAWGAQDPRLHHSVAAPHLSTAWLLAHKLGQNVQEDDPLSELSQPPSVVLSAAVGESLDAVQDYPIRLGLP